MPLKPITEPANNYSITSVARPRIRGGIANPSSKAVLTLTTKSNEARARAEASFSKEERAKEGAKAMMEYLANSRMVREKTERLKALRLAKEAADKERSD